MERTTLVVGARTPERNRRERLLMVRTGAATAVRRASQYDRNRRTLARG
jgi:hypothetical protein